MELEGISLVSLTLSFKATKWSVSGYVVVLELQMKNFLKKVIRSYPSFLGNSTFKKY